MKKLILLMTALFVQNLQAMTCVEVFSKPSSRVPTQILLFNLSEGQFLTIEKVDNLYSKGDFSAGHQELGKSSSQWVRQAEEMIDRTRLELSNEVLDAEFVGAFEKLILSGRAYLRLLQALREGVPAHEVAAFNKGSNYDLLFGKVVELRSVESQVLSKPMSAGGSWFMYDLPGRQPTGPLHFEFRRPDERRTQDERSQHGIFL